MVMLSNNGMIDFSFIPSLECNIECPFCMYDSRPTNKAELNVEQTIKFIDTMDWSLINSIGFYGGEPSINLPLYQTFLDLLPQTDKQKFIISNGSWSTNIVKTMEFIDFLILNHFYLVVSGTPYHKKFQDRKRLLELQKLYPTAMRLKGDDKIHPMGRASVEEWDCSKKCQTFEGPMRLGLFPNGNILFQNCDGQYPVVQTYFDPFVDIIQKVNIIKNECVNSREGVCECLT